MRQEVSKTLSDFVRLCVVTDCELKRERMMTMVERTEKKIRLNELEEVKEFVHAAGKCDFDIDVSYNRIIIDAKSMLGVLSLDLTRELTVKYGGKDLQFENVLSKYTVA